MIKLNLQQAMKQYNSESALGHRIHNKLTLRKLHELTGVSIHALSDIYNGKVKSIKLDNLNRLVGFFGGNVSYLISYTPEIKKVQLLGTMSKPTLLIATNHYSGKLSINIKITSRNRIGKMQSDDISIICKTIHGSSVKNNNLVNYLFGSSTAGKAIINYLVLRLCPQISMFHRKNLYTTFVSFNSFIVDGREIIGEPSLLYSNMSFTCKYHSQFFNMLKFNVTDYLK